MKRLSSWLLSVSLAGLFAGCAGSGPQLINQRSIHFERVNQHLDLGGVAYLYLDVEGDAEMLAREIQGWLESLPEFDLDLPRIVRGLGLDGLTALGLSSVKDGTIFHNKAFLYHRGQRRGLLGFAGSQPRDFEIPALAPADADAVFEAEMRGKSVFQELEPLITELAGARAMAVLDENIPGLAMSWRKLLGMLDTRLLGVVRFDPANSTPLPGTQVLVPRIDAVLAIDSLGELFDAVKKVLANMPVAQAGEDPRFSFVGFVLPLPPGLDWLSPVLAKDKSTGRVYLATHLDFVQDCLDKPDKLASAEAFRKAITGLPTRGNSLSYTSPELTGEIHRIVDGLPGMGAPEKKIVRSVLKLVLPTPGVPTATVTTQLADGIYTASNATSSHKESLLLLQYLNPMVLGILSAVAIPAFVRYTERAKMAHPGHN